MASSATADPAVKRPQVRLSILHVSHAAKPIVPSKHFNVDDWKASVNTHTLLDEVGVGAVPVSEGRFLWGQGQLYLAFYAADLDLEVHNEKHDGPVWNDDSFTIEFFTGDDRMRVITVSPTGVVADGVCPTGAVHLGDAGCDRKWQSLVRVAFDYDGTINKVGDYDEEWNVELAIPLRSISAASSSGTSILFALKRCEIAYNGVRACGLWGSAAQPAELVLD